MPKIIANLRERLMEEGKRQLGESSSKEVNVREIAKSCGIGLGTFYNYFPDKECYMAELEKTAWDELNGLLDELIEADTGFKSKLQTIFEYIVKCHKGKNRDVPDAFAGKLQELIERSAAEREIKPVLPAERLSRFIAVNLVYLGKTEYMDYEDFYTDILRGLLEQKANVVKVYL